MEMKMGVYTRNNETYDFNFYTDLSAANKLKFVNSVVSVLVDDSHYNSVIRDLIFDFYMIDVMTDIDLMELKTSSTFLNDAENFLEETNIVDIIKVNVRPTLFNELNKAVDNSIAYLTGIHSNQLNDALASLMNTIEAKINEIDLVGMTDIVQKFSGITEDFTIEKLIDAYIDSDFHKNNLKEIEDAKNIRTEFAKNLDNAIKTVNNSVVNKK